MVHRTEAFGPVSTLMPYRNLDHALTLIRRGEGSLVASVYGADSGHARAGWHRAGRQSRSGACDFTSGRRDPHRPRQRDAAFTA